MNGVGTAIKSLVKSNARRFGYDIARIEKVPDVSSFLASRRIETVFDVGANRGEFAGSIRAAGYAGKIVSFEPIRATFATLQSTASGDPRWETVNAALGAEAGTATIRVSEYSNFSSILPLTKAAEAFSEHSAVERLEEVPVLRLDDLYAPYANTATFLKIDTQGFERHVLDGARVALRSISGLLLELPIVHLYADTWSFTEAMEYINDAGFVLSQIAPVNYLTVDPESLVEVDCLFRRRNDEIDGERVPAP